jgi:hypothetical protein
MPCRVSFTLFFIFWVTLPSAVHSLICAQTNGGNQQQKKRISDIFRSMVHLSMNPGECNNLLEALKVVVFSVEKLATSHIYFCVMCMD